MNPHILRASLLQLSGIIGVGIFGLPFVFAHSNLTFSLFLLPFLVAATLFINYAYTKVILKTTGDHQLSGYVQKHLGQNLFHLSNLNILVLSFAAILAFVQFGGTFLAVVFPFVPAHFGSLLFVIFILLIYIQKSRTWHTIFELLPILFLMIPLFLFSLSSLSPPSSFVVPTPSLFFVGWTMFALSGFTIIPEVEEVLRDTGQRQHTLSAVALGTLLAFAIYLVFILAITRLSGNYLTWDTVTGLSTAQPFAAKLVAALGVLTTLKGSLNFLTVIQETLHQDLRLSKNTTISLVTLIPVFGLILQKFDFSTLLRPLATISVAISISLILLMYHRLFPKNKLALLSILTLLLFVFATLAELK